MMGSIAEDWTVKAAKGRKIQQDSIPKRWQLLKSNLPSPEQTCVIAVANHSGILSEKELTITETTAGGLVRRMASGTWTAEEVTVAFLKRATIGQQLTNFATEFLADTAVPRAKELDEIFRKTGNIVGPLHGVPISVKEHIGVRGRICNAGYVAWCDYVSPDDAFVLQLLQNAGAVAIVRTNEPQSLMHLDSNNNITGKTSNPHNLNLSAGGSSGGEGVSLAFKCAALGVGSDMAGSIRAPAAFNGVHGFKPTAGRIPLMGLRATGMGQESLHGVVGPLANSIDDMELFMRACLDQSPWLKDITLVPLPWRLVHPPTSFTVAIMKDDGLVHPHPPMIRALQLAEERLVAAGIKVVEWKPYRHQEIFDLLKGFFFVDGGKEQREVLQESGEPIHPLTHVALSWGKEVDVSENWKMNSLREQLRAEYYGLMLDRGVDFVLGPPYVGVAPENGTASYTFYTSLWNVMDNPALIFPTGLTVDQSLDLPDVTYQPRSEEDAREYAKYSPEKFSDAPITLQLAGKHFHDEELIAAARIVEAIIVA